MEAKLSYADDEARGQLHEVTPSVVRRVIEIALREGWKPTQPSLPPFRVQDADARAWSD